MPPAHAGARRARAGSTRASGAANPLEIEGNILTDPWYRRPQILLAGAVFALTVGVYVATLAPTTSFWDCGEFITTSHIVGIPHQPGTPLYVLVGRVFDILLGTPDITEPAMRTAWAVNFMSAFFSALAVMFVYLIIWEPARRADPDANAMAHVGGIVGAVFLAFSETFWNNAVEAEVYGLSGFMLALLTWLAIRWYDHRETKASNRLLLLMIYLLGLGVGFHLGSLLVYPGLFLLVLLSDRKQLRLIDLLLMSAGLAIFLYSTTTRDNESVVFLLVVFAIAALVRLGQKRTFVAAGSLLFLVGLSVHIMMLIRAGASPEPLVNQTDPDDFGKLMEVIRREQYPPINPFERQAPLEDLGGRPLELLLAARLLVDTEGPKGGDFREVCGRAGLLHHLFAGVDPSGVDFIEKPAHGLPVSPCLDRREPPATEVRLLLAGAPDEVGQKLDSPFENEDGDGQPDEAIEK